MNVYSYDNNGIYNKIIVLDDSDRDPLNPDDFLVPAGCTVIAPPPLLDNEVAVWDSGRWDIKTDKRGVTYWLNDAKHIMTDLGDLPNGAKLEKPESVLAQELSSAKSAALQKIEAVADECQSRFLGANSPQRESRFSQNLSAAKRIVSGVGTPEDLQSMEMQAAAKAAETGETPKAATEFAAWIAAWEGKTTLIAGAIEAFLVQSRIGLNALSDISHIEPFLADIAAQAEAKFAELAGS